MSIKSCFGAYHSVVARVMVLLFVLGALCSVGGLRAEIIHWIGPDGGDWWDAANWDQAKVPQSPGQTARFSMGYNDKGKTIIISDPQKLSIDQIDVTGDGEWTFLLKGSLVFDPESPYSHYTNRTINVTGSSKLVFVGGKLVNASYRVTTGTKGGGENSIVFSNSVNEAAFTHYRNGSDEDASDSFTIDGGVHRFRTWYPRLYDRMTVNAGLVSFGSIHGYDRIGEGYDIRRDDALLVKGGKVVIDGVGVDGNMTSMCVGILAANDSVVDIQVSGKDMWLANFQDNAKGKTCTWKVQDKALFVAPGPYVVPNAVATGNVEVAGGRFVMKSRFSNTATRSSVSGSSSTFLLNGGVLDLAYSVGANLEGTSLGESSGHRLAVGPSGARVRNRNNVVVNITGDGFVPAQDGDGGVLYEGCGRFDVGAGSYAGGTVIRGYVNAITASGAFGAGAVMLKDGGRFRTETASSVLSALSYTNGVSVQLASASANLTVPSIDGFDGSVLMLNSDASRTVFGTGDAPYVKSDSPPVLDMLGLPVSPIVAITKESGNSAAELHLLTFDAETRKFKLAEYVDGMDCGQDKIACVSGDVSPGSANVGAIVARGAHLLGGNATIGNGTGNAYLVLLANSSGKAISQLTGGGSINFGTACGYVLSGAAISGTTCGGAINGYLKGSGGVVFCSASNGGIALYRKQSYTGGTKVIGGVVVMLATGSYKGDFADGKVVVAGGEYTGGTVCFKNDGETYSQDYEISGFGATGTKVGALDFQKNVTMAGNVRIANDAMVTAAYGYVGTFSKTISGNGDLYLGSEAGTGAIVLSGGVDIDGDLHVDTCVTNSGPIDLDGRFIYLNGTLVFNNSQDITVNAKVIGEGRIVLAGSGKVDFKDVSVFDGVIDVEGNGDAAIGGLWGVATVTNSVPEKGTLCVSGASEYGFFGSVLDGVNLAVSGGFLVGYGADISKDSSLILNGGEVTFLKQMEFTDLFGRGNVSGSAITVSGAVQPTAEGHEDAIVFEYPPVFLNGVPDGWSLHRHDDGMALRLAYGTTVVIR